MTPLLALDPSHPLPRLDQQHLLDQARKGVEKDQNELEGVYRTSPQQESLMLFPSVEGILAQLDHLKCEVLIGVYQAHTALRRQLSETLNARCEEIAKLEDVQDAARNSLEAFLYSVSSALTSLFGEDFKPPSTQSDLEPKALLLIDPCAKMEKLDLEALRKRSEEGAKQDSDALEELLKPICGYFDRLVIDCYTCCKLQAEDDASQIRDELKAVEEEEKAQDQERLAIQTLLERLRAAFDAFPTSV
ncbi:hypothetical protein JCM11641_000721 [Rhodosporidiobolus odoratus]